MGEWTRVMADGKDDNLYSKDRLLRMDRTEDDWTDDDEHGGDHGDDPDRVLAALAVSKL